MLDDRIRALRALEPDQGRGHQTYEEILQAARGLFMFTPIEQVGITQLIKYAGVWNSSFYNYFKTDTYENTKDNLIIVLYDKFCRKIKHDFNNKLTGFSSSIIDPSMFLTSISKTLVECFLGAVSEDEFLAPRLVSYLKTNNLPIHATHQDEMVKAINKALTVFFIQHANTGINGFYGTKADPSEISRLSFMAVYAIHGITQGLLIHPEHDLSEIQKAVAWVPFNIFRPALLRADRGDHGL